MSKITADAVTRHLGYTEEQFDERLKHMTMKDLVDVISTLQGEMTEEQTHFDSIGSRLAECDHSEGSPEHIALSTQLMKSQTKLTMLIGRNMKCFMQQTENQNKALLAETSHRSASPPPNESSQNQKCVIVTAAKSPTSITTSHNPVITVTTNPTKQHSGNSDLSSGDQMNMNAGKTTGAPPWKKTSNKEQTFKVNHAQDLNIKPDLRSPVQAGNSSPTVSNMNKRNGPVNSSTKFSIRSSVTKAQTEDTQNKENEEKSDDSERINFSAAFNMFESCTLPRGNKKTFGVPKCSTADSKAVDQHDGPKVVNSGDHTQNSIAKSPSSHGTKDFQYYTLPNRPKKSSMTNIVLSPPAPSNPTSPPKVKQISNTQSNGVTPTKEKSAESTETLPPVKTTPQTMFRSNVSTIIPSPPPQASYSPSQNIQWPLKNKTGYSPGNRPVTGNRPAPARNTTGMTRSVSGPVKVGSPGGSGQGVTGGHGGTTARTNGYHNIGNKQGGPSVPGPQSQVLQNHQGNQQNGSSGSSNDGNATVFKITKPPQQTDSTTTQKPPSPVINHSQKPAEVKEIIQKEQKQQSPVFASNKNVFSSATQKSEATFKLTNQSPKLPSPPVVVANQSFKPPSPPVLSNQKSVKELTNGYSDNKTVTNGDSVVKSSVTVVTASTNQGAAPVEAPQSFISGDELLDDEKIKDKLTLKNWDPTILLEDLYQVKLLPDAEDDSSFINMEGYMEKLPTNKKKATLLKTWKRRYFKAKDGKLYYFESRNHARGAELSLVEAESTYWEESNAPADKASAYFQLMGGNIEELGGRMVGVDDGRGRYLVVRCPTDKEYNDWIQSLNSQTGGNIRSTYIKPLLSTPPHSNKKVIIVDIGSCSIRAGILGEKPALPSVFFPSIVATDKRDGEMTFGAESYKPDVRANANITFPVRPSTRIDKSVDMDVMSGLFRKIYNKLGVNPKHYWVMFSAPSNLSDKLKEQFMDILIRQYDAPGVNIVNQSLLALYSYNAKTGIVVDIGDRLEIVPVTDGYVAEGGVTKQLYGGHRVGEALNSALTERKYHFFTDPENLIVRLVMEKLCFVSENYDEDLNECTRDPKYFLDGISLSRYELPEGYTQEVSVDMGRFKTAEGLFNTEVWGMDNPPLHKLVQKAVQASPLDTRREMWRSIYLSGGATVLPGFMERLQSELNKIAPPSIVVQVHASPQRYHAAFIGASTLASLPQFEQSCISNEEWLKQGPKILRKWHMY